MIPLADSQTSSFNDELKDLKSEYETYLIRFKKKMDRLDDDQRLKRFNFSRTLISNHNMDGSQHYSLSINEFSDYTIDELNARKKSFIQLVSNNLSPPPASSPFSSFSSSSSSSSFSLKEQRRLINRRNPIETADLQSSHNSIPSSLNWATNQNPLGYSVSPPIENQV